MEKVMIKSFEMKKLDLKKSALRWT